MKISANTNRPQQISGMTDSENDLVCQVYMDLFRTKDPLSADTTISISQEDMLANLRILYAVCAKVFPETGYCQGINYISVIFYKIMKTGAANSHEAEQMAFKCMIAFILKKKLKGLYVKKVNEYHLQNFMLKQLLKQHLPALHTHLVKSLQMQTEMVTTQWILTMFTGWISDQSYILPILDNFMIPMDGKVEKRENEIGDTKQRNLDNSRRSWIFIFSVILALFKFNEEKLLKMGDFGVVA